MKKIALFTGLVLALGTAVSAHAATLSISPTTVWVKEGETVTVTVSADPTGEKLYTVKTVLSYPADVLEAKSFTFSNGLLALTQPGYDSMGNGTIVKTAGVSGGFTSTRTVGTATFTAKKAGVATIAVQSTSLALDSQSKNKLSGAQGSATVTVAAPQVAEPTPAAPAPVTTPGQASAPAASTVTGAVVAQNAPEVTDSEEVASTTDENLLAAAEASGATIPMWVYAVIAAALVIGGGAWWFLRRKTPMV
jgi:hypothetical protein